MSARRKGELGEPTRPPRAQTKAKSAPGELTSVGPDGERLKIPEPVARRVWALSAGRCAMCNDLLLHDDQTGESVFVGQLAHIVGATGAAGSPRGTSAMSREERRSERNLMLLCHSQHKTIDDKSLWDVYSVEDLKAIKARHEREIRELGGLRGRRKSTVLRVVGGIRNQVYDASKRPIVSTLLAEQSYPDWSLLDGQDFEVDLRDLPGEDQSEAYYWQSVEAKLRDRLAPLPKYVRDGKIESLAVFPFARIPALVLLGSLLEDGLAITLYPKRRSDGGGWGWPANPADPVTFEVVNTAGTGSPVVLFSLSASLRGKALPAELAGHSVYEVAPTTVPPSPDLLSSAEDLDNFTRTWRGLLADLEVTHPGQPISIIGAVPVTAAVAIGQARMTATHPPFHVYDLLTGSSDYQKALTIGSSEKAR